MPPPRQSPYDRFAKAVQAHAMHLLGGGSLEGAEAAAKAASGGLFNEDVARASRGARAAGQAVTSDDPQADVLLDAARLASERPASTVSVVTAAFLNIHEGGTAPRWSHVQVNVDPGASREAILGALLQAATEIAEGDEYGYPLEIVDLNEGGVFDVMTIIGVI